MRHPIAPIAAALLDIHSDLCHEAVDAFTIIARIDVVGAPTGSLGHKHSSRVERIIRLPTAVDWDRDLAVCSGEKATPAVHGCEWKLVADRCRGFAQPMGLHQWATLRAKELRRAAEPASPPGLALRDAERQM